MSKNREVIERRSWWRKHFDDHPGAAARSPDAYVESDTRQTKSRKVYCGACLIADVEQIMKEDLRAVDLGRMTVPRAEHEIKTYRELIN